MFTGLSSIGLLVVGAFGHLKKVMCVECRTRADIQDSRFKIQDSRFVLVPSFSLTCLFRTERGKKNICNSGGYFIFHLELVFYSYSF